MGAALRAGRRQAGGGDGDDLGEPTSDPGRHAAQKCTNLSHLTSSMGAGGARAHPKNGLKPQTSRDTQKNSNARFVRTPFDRGFIAAIDLPADKIFSRDFGSKPGNAAVDRQRLRVYPADSALGWPTSRILSDISFISHHVCAG